MTELHWLFVVVVLGFCAVAIVLSKGLDRIIDRLDEIEKRLRIIGEPEPDE